MTIPEEIRLVIFDLDGTLIKPKTVTERPRDIRTGWGYRQTADDWEWLFDRKDAVLSLAQRGYYLALATNQGGVAFGKLDYETLDSELYKVADALGIDYVGVCYYHPKATLEAWRKDSFLRKPQPGMLRAAMQWCEVSAQETLMVGDRADDEGAARNAGCRFAWADEFFGDVL